jgi:hypothetical protein
MCHAVDEGAAADNRRCGRLRIGSSGSGVSGPVFRVEARFAEPRPLAPAVARTATTVLTCVVTPHPRRNTVRVKTYAFGCRRAAGPGQGDADFTGGARPSAGWPSVEAGASRRGRGVKGGEAAERDPLTPLSAVRSRTDDGHRATCRFARGDFVLQALPRCVLGLSFERRSVRYTAVERAYQHQLVIPVDSRVVPAG